MFIQIINVISFFQIRLQKQTAAIVKHGDAMIVLTGNEYVVILIKAYFA